MSKKANLDRLAQLHDADLDAVVAVVESALMLGNGWLQRQEDDGRLTSMDVTKVVLSKRAGFSRSQGVDDGDDGGYA